MKISLITPAAKRSHTGNRTTAERWAVHLRKLGHQVDIAVDYDDRPADLMIALHAWRSAAAAQRFHALYPDRPLIAALGGTDIYGFQKSDPKTTLGTLEIADEIVCLHDLVYRDIPRRFHKKLHVIHQSALPLKSRPAKTRRFFDVCVIGHLREEKDPLRTAMAAALLPVDSAVRVLHFGVAHNADWARAAQDEMKRNPRYHWKGEVPYWQVRRTMGKSHLMVLSSNQEGGANVISEALVAKLPVVASRIVGSVWLLGADYPGYYKLGDEKALARLMGRCENDRKFLDTLAHAGAKKVKLFHPEHELAAWRRLLAGLDAGGR